MITNIIIDGIDAKISDRKQIESFETEVSIEGAEFTSPSAELYINLLCLVLAVGTHAFVSDA